MRIGLRAYVINGLLWRGTIGLPIAIYIDDNAVSGLFIPRIPDIRPGKGKARVYNGEEV